MTTAPAACLAIVLACLVAGSVRADAQTAANVALVINGASVASQRIGDHYARTRGIPVDNIIHIRTTPDEAIDRAAYLREIEGPVAAALARHHLQDRILYIVLTKGVPLRISGTEGVDGTVSSVDSELTLLYRRMAGTEVPVRGRVSNPYYLGAAPVGSAQPFTHRTYDIYLVTRLDAFTVDEAIALIDRARTPASEGRFVLDQRAGLLSNPMGDRWLAEAHKRLAAMGRDVVFETTAAPARGVDRVIGYYSWGSNDPENRVRQTAMRFLPGAIAGLFVSTDARTMMPPPDEWKVTGDWNSRVAQHAGSPQSLIGDLIREGVTGVAGHVAEPYLQSTARPEILFPAYVSGFNLAEAFYLAIPDLSWQTVVIGDPLCAPFPRRALTDRDIHDGFDTATELPALLAARRLERARAQFQAPVDALQQVLRAESRLRRMDAKGAQQALEAATSLAPDLAGAQLQLGMMYDALGEHARARERYEQVLKARPNDVAALNNLAYSLGTRAGDLPRALPLARRAASLAPDNVSVIDSLAWLEHLSGDSKEAARLIRTILLRAAGDADVQVHAAAIFAALGDRPTALQHLEAAVKLRPDLEQSDLVRQIRARLK